MLSVWDRSAGQGGDLDQVVGQDGLSGPDASTVEAVETGAVPAVAAFEAADPALAAGAPLDGSAERRSVLGGLAGLTGSALAGGDDGADSEVVQVVLDAGLAVAAVGGHGARAAAGAGDHPRHSGCQLRGVGRIALIEGVVQDHAVVVVEHLALVAELDRPPEPALGDRASGRVVQADPPGRAVGRDPGQALAGFRGGPPGRPPAPWRAIRAARRPAPPPAP